MGTFKLADEAQMGGLNRLMVEADAKNGKCANINTNNNNDGKPMTDAMETDEDKDDEKGNTRKISFNSKLAITLQFKGQKLI